MSEKFTHLVLYEGKLYEEDKTQRSLREMPEETIIDRTNGTCYVPVSAAMKKRIVRLLDEGEGHEA